MKKRWRRISRFVPVVVVAVMLGVIPASTIARSSDSAGELPWTWTLGNYRQTANVVVGSDALVVEVSDTSLLRERGLSYHADLLPNTGMLFVYDDIGKRIYWMKGMNFCLDIVWINDSQIVGAAESVCPEPNLPDADLDRYPSPPEVQYVLEVPAGWLAERGYGVGTPVDLSGLSG
jgi:uncharacterized membrane protein (UPF0127 family)